MQSRPKVVVIAALALTLVALLATAPAVAQSPDYEAPRHYDGHPDLNGIWQAIGTAYWDLQDHAASAGPPELGATFAVPPGQGVVEGSDSSSPRERKALCIEAGGGEAPRAEFAL